MKQERLPPPPHDIEAEEAVIGSLLIDPETILEVATFLKPEDFFSEINRWVYEACLSLHERNEVINQITVAHELMRQGKLEQIGGVGYLSQLISVTPTSLHAEHYAKVVKRCADSLKLIALGGQLAAAGYVEKPLAEAIPQAVSSLLSLQHDSKEEGLVSLASIATKHIGEVTDWLESEHRLRGYSTGFKGLDRVIDGLEKSKLYLIAGRPSMGKTQLCINIARALAKNGLKIAMFSLEQNQRAILERMVLSEAKLDRYQLRQSEEISEERAKFWVAWGDTEKLPLWIDDTTAIKTQDAVTKLLSLQTTQGVDCMMFDYIGLAGNKDTNEVLRIGQIVKDLRAIARLVNIPVIAVSQLSRAPEARQDRRPSLADLRSSGELEQVADVVIGLYREEFYKKDTDKKNALETIILKNRDGPRGFVELYYEANTGFMADKVRKAK